MKKTMLNRYEATEALMRAAESGDLARVREFIAAGVEVDAADFSGQQALHHAAGNGHLPVVKYLLRKGAKVDAPGEDGMRPLHLAARNGDLPMLDFLLGKGAKVDAPDIWGCQPLHYAATAEAAERLLNRGARPDAADIYDRQPLHHAVMEGRLPVVEVLLAAGADPAAKSRYGEIPSDFGKKYPEIHAALGNALKRWLDSGAVEKRRQEANAKAVRDHWKKVAGHVPSGPRL